MKGRLITCVAVVTLSGLAGTAQAAEKPTGSQAAAAAKALPVLLIKGEVVSVDSSDPNATLLKVKDRYGFETPIYVAEDTKVTQNDAPVSVANLTPGTPVGVEYNFDVNTAKRHAVSVKVEPAAPAAPAAATPAEPAAPAAPEATAPAAQPTPTAPAPAAPSSAPSDDKPAAQ